MKLRFLLKYEEDVLLYDIEHENASVSFGDMRRRQDELKKMQASRSERIEYENAAFAGAVRRWLIRFESMLIGEVVYLAVTGLESRDIPKGMFDHVVIDEYQDLTAAEQELVTFVWSESGSLTVMGDDDQSIYSFRYNHPSGISDFEGSWPPEKFRRFDFVGNRRCGEKILRVANAMMAEAGSSKPPMQPKTGRLGNLHLVEWNTLDKEIVGLANYIKSRQDETFLVLVPRRYIGYRLSDEIGDDAQTSFMEEVLEHSIAKEAFTAVCLLANPDDLVAARVWLGFHGTAPKLVTGRNSVAFLRLPKDIGGHELLRKIEEGNVELSGTGQQNIRLRAKIAIEWIDKNLGPDEIVATFFNPERAVLEQNEEKRGWLEKDLMELREAANEILSNQDTQDHAEMVETLRYRIATRAPLKPVSEDARVKIMTLHAAKGLDARNVVVAGIADQLIPGHDADDHEKAEEHRRLLYVAVTRAKENLVVSWPRFIRSDIMSNKKVFGRKDGRPWPSKVNLDTRRRAVGYFRKGSPVLSAVKSG